MSSVMAMIRQACLLSACDMPLLIVAFIGSFSQCALQRENEIKEKERFSLKENKGSRHQRLFSKNVRKIEKKVSILEKWVWKLFMHGEDVSTPTHLSKRRQSLIECVKNKITFKIFIFPF